MPTSEPFITVPNVILELKLALSNAEMSLCGVKYIQVTDAELNTWLQDHKEGCHDHNYWSERNDLNRLTVSDPGLHPCITTQRTEPDDSITV